MRAAIALGLVLSAIDQMEEVRPKRADYLALPYTLSVTADRRCDATALASLVRREPDGVERVLWRTHLVSNPIFVFVDPVTGWAVTMGNECSYAQEHAVVVYGSGGRVLLDVSLTDVLTPQERLNLGFEELSSTPRTLAPDERTGGDPWRGGGRIVFAPDAVWLTHPNLARRVMLLRR